MATDPVTLRGHDDTGRAGGGVLAVHCGESGLASAGRDGKVLQWGTPVGITGEASPSRELMGHGTVNGEGRGTNSQNVCCLAEVGGRLASGGWDKTARVWAGPGEGAVAGDAAAAAAAVAAAAAAALGGEVVVPATSLCLLEHPVAVNSCCALPGGLLATGCGDGIVRLFAVGAAGGPEAGAGREAGGGRCAGPVRAVCAVPGFRGGVGLAAVSNDGLLRVWAAADGYGSVAAATSLGEGLAYHYGVAAGADGEIFTGGEDGVVTVWSHGLKPLQRVALPATVYSMAALESGDLAVGCADRSVYVLTRDASRAAPPAEAAALAATVAAAPAGALAASLTAAPAPAVLSGAAVAAAAAAATGQAPSVATAAPPPHHEGQASFPAAGSSGPPYELNFPVELSAGGQLTLSWNRGEPAEVVARRFLEEHGMGADQLPDIVAFVHQAEQAMGGPAPAAAQAAAGPSEADKRTMVAAVMEMGVDEATAAGALGSVEWASVEAAIGLLFGS